MAGFEFLLLLGTSGLLVWYGWSARAALTQRRILLAALAVIGVVHVLLDGVRWQMIPVYAILLVLSVLVLRQWQPKRRWLGILSFVGAVLLLVLSGLAAQYLPRFTFPRSTYTVGTTLLSLDYKDETLPAKLWYPALASSSKEVDLYCDAPTQQLDGVMGLPGWVFSHLRLVRTPALRGAKPFPNNRYPLILYAHGGSSAYIDNTRLLQELASAGYMVLSVHFNFSFERYDLEISLTQIPSLDEQRQLVQDRTVPVQADMLQAALNHLQNDPTWASQIDWDKVAILGHSLGGTTALEAALAQPAIKTIINLDGPVVLPDSFNAVPPLLYLSSFNPDQPNEVLEAKGLPYPDFYRDLKLEELGKLDQLMAGLKTIGTPCQHYRIPQAGHLDLTDLPYLSPLMATKGADRDAVHDLMRELIVAYLHHQLNQGPEAPFPELVKEGLERVE